MKQINELVNFSAQFSSPNLSSGHPVESNFNHHHHGNSSYGPTNSRLIAHHHSTCASSSSSSSGMSTHGLSNNTSTVNIPQSLLAPKRQRRSTDHSKIVVKRYGKNASTSSNNGAVMAHFKSLSYKPQKRLRKKKKADPKLVDFLWRQIESADIHAVSVLQNNNNTDSSESSSPNSTLTEWCCDTNRFHSYHHHHTCPFHRKNPSKKDSFSLTGVVGNGCEEDGVPRIEKNRVVRTSISIRELLL
ncbi:hypothetical protein FDP41_000625 [Naegleria fowleri]|uniref:Uncharacterized protein n=1 Tax=Naegleria fowleri TaxID=5763 RepID=A0A6A5CAF5_NAEFO|nr:uncharacterized protein FDP41_000625 [Naegleria fowleri]KAF0984726.1 hypothetical protein FDP41_000625 [Naegleria fowleri]CAG4716640.1 unnamed protein product [Naegleria fowleri]